VTSFVFFGSEDSFKRNVNFAVEDLMKRALKFEYSRGEKMPSNEV